MIVKNMQLKIVCIILMNTKKEQEMTKTRIQLYAVHPISSGATTLYFKSDSLHQLLSKLSLAPFFLIQTRENG